MDICNNGFAIETSGNVIVHGGDEITTQGLKCFNIFLSRNFIAFIVHKKNYDLCFNFLLLYEFCNSEIHNNNLETPF